MPNIDITSRPGSLKKNQTGGWRTYKPVIDKSKCIGCGNCVRVCPESSAQLTTNKKGEKKAKIDYKFCKGCGLCAEQCPVGAIKMVLEDK